MIPHKVNDFYETNSQQSDFEAETFYVVIPHKVNDFYETNSQRLVNNRIANLSCDSSQS